MTFPNEKFGILPDRMNDYVNMIKSGRENMKKSRVILLGLARDLEPMLISSMNMFENCV